MKMANTLSRVFRVAMNGDEAVLSGGSSADMAIWFSEKTGKWVSSSYYKPVLPDWLKAYNTWVESDRFVDKGWMMLSDEDKSPARIRLRNHFYYDIARARSEERRVGQEGRSRWWPYHEKSFLLLYSPREEGIQYLPGAEGYALRKRARAGISGEIDRRGAFGRG